MHHPSRAKAPPDLCAPSVDSEVPMNAPIAPTQFQQPNLPRHDALALTGGGACATIQLGDQLYTLRITKQGKLILTK